MVVVGISVLGAFQWRSEDDSVVLIFLFHLDLGSKNHIQVTRLVQKVPLPAEPLHQSNFVIFRTLLLLAKDNLNQCS